MTTIPQEKLDRLEERWRNIQGKLAAGPEQSEFIKLSKEFSDLDPIVALVRSLREAIEELDGLRQIVEDADSDAEMRELAEAEIPDIEAHIDTLKHDVRIALLPRDVADEKSAIVEVRAGTGGEEAALFAGDLLRMYQRYAASNGWKVQIIAENETGKGGYREVIVSFTGKNVFARLKFESGVHRVQRVPETETSGRIHTSAATVAVLPEAADIDIEIRPEDIRIDTMRASGAGGQHVNTTDSAVRITHIPTGMVVTSSEKSQHQNRARAMQVLRARLYDAERMKAEEERAASRKGQVGSGDRSQRIRTYNFPQGRVTDHRINMTLYNLQEVLAGEGLDEFLDALIADYQASQLAEMEGLSDG
ncbi:MAG: peptide chain release factor 1 [Hyphomicrobiales bacterium]|nr:peptide chain release factor 1 [Hyphomicrobiales bacterium]